MLISGILAEAASVIGVMPYISQHQTTAIQQQTEELTLTLFSNSSKPPVITKKSAVWRIFIIYLCAGPGM